MLFGSRNQPAYNKTRMKIAKTTTTRRRIDSFTANQLRAATRRGEMETRSPMPTDQTLPVIENARIGPCLMAAISHPMTVTASDITKRASNQSAKAQGNQVKNGTASVKSTTIFFDSSHPSAGMGLAFIDDLQEQVFQGRRGIADRQQLAVVTLDDVLYFHLCGGA